MTASTEEPELRSRIDEVLSHGPVAGLAVGVIRHGSPAWFHSHGVADAATGLPVGLRLYPEQDDPSAFRVNLPGFGSGTSLVVFSQDRDGQATAFHLGYQPMTFRRLGGRSGDTKNMSMALLDSGGLT